MSQISPKPIDTSLSHTQFHDMITGQVTKINDQFTYPINNEKCKIPLFIKWLTNLLRPQELQRIFEFCDWRNGTTRIEQIRAKKT